MVTNNRSVCAPVQPFLAGSLWQAARRTPFQNPILSATACPGCFQRQIGMSLSRDELQIIALWQPKNCTNRRMIFSLPRVSPREENKGPIFKVQFRILLCIHVWYFFTISSSGVFQKWVTDGRVFFFFLFHKRFLRRPSLSELCKELENIEIRLSKLSNLRPGVGKHPQLSGKKRWHHWYAGTKTIHSRRS